MPRLQYYGRDEDGEPIWKERETPWDAGCAPGGIVRGEGHHTKHSRWKYEDMTGRQKAYEGFKNAEERGWKLAHSKEQVKRIWGFK